MILLCFKKRSGYGGTTLQELKEEVGEAPVRITPRKVNVEPP